jgi:hypothetical protein
MGQAMTIAVNRPPQSYSPDERNSRRRQRNAEHAHEVAASKERAAQMTHEERIAFGHATYDAFSARLQAVQGLPSLSAVAAQRYLTLDHIWRLGMPLAPPLAETLYRAWSAGRLLTVSAWLDGNPPPDPAGSWAVI